MSINLQSAKNFEETVETVFRHMGYHTQTNITLHTRPVHIHAEMHHPKGKQKLLIECKHYHHHHESVGVHDVQRFCDKIAFAREQSRADIGLLVSNTEFSPEAVSWCARNCSFVKLRTYKQVLHASTRCRKLLRKFHKHM